MEWLKFHWPDLLTALIIIICTAAGYKRGIVKTVIMIAGLAAAFIAAGFISAASCEYVYMRFVQPGVVETIENSINSPLEKFSTENGLKALFDERGTALSPEQEEMIFGESSQDLTEKEICDTLNSIFYEYCGKLTSALSDVLPEEIAEKAGEQLSEMTSGREMLDIMRGGSASAAEMIELHAVRPVMIRTVKRVIFAVVFAIVMAAIGIAAGAFGILRKINAVRDADSFLGGIFGLLCGCVVIAALTVFCGMYIGVTADGSQIMNSDILSSTYFYKYIYTAVSAVF